MVTKKILILVLFLLLSSSISYAFMDDYHYFINIKSDKNVHLGEPVNFDIIIFNEGKEPTDDTVMIYYLISPNNDVVGKSREQFFEPDIGMTELKRKILIPKDMIIGKWKIVVQYHTVIQKTIIEEQNFNVIEERTIFEKIFLWLNEVLK